MFGANTFENQVEIMSEIKRLEEMIKAALPDACVYNREEGGVKDYVKNRLEEIGCADVPISEIFNREQWDMLMKYSKEDKVMAFYYAFVTGFANGVERERKKQQKTS